MTEKLKSFMDGLVECKVQIDLGDFFMRLFDTENLDDAITRFEEDESGYWTSWKKSLHCTDNCLYDIIEDCLNKQIELWRIDGCESDGMYQCFMTLNSYTGDSWDVEFLVK